MNLLLFGTLIGISMTLLATFIILTYDHLTKEEQTTMQIVQVGKERSMVLITNGKTKKETYYLFNNDILTELKGMGVIHEPYSPDFNE